jgi:hypothetical protein
MRRKLKFVSNSGSSGNKKCKRGYGGACGGVWRSLCLAGVPTNSGSWFCDGASVAVKIFFTFNLFYEFGIFSAICKDNSVTNSTVVKQKRGT